MDLKSLEKLLFTPEILEKYPQIKEDEKLRKVIVASYLDSVTYSLKNSVYHKIVNKVDLEKIIKEVLSFHGRDIFSNP